LPEDETISVEEWLTDSSITAGTQRNRRKFLRDYQEANGGKAARQILEDIRARRVGLYLTGRKFVDHLRAKDCLPSTVTQFRSMLPGFWESTLGEDSFRRRVFDRQVPIGDSYVTTTKKAPTRDQFRYMLRIAKPQYRALLGMMACTGMRISEAVSRKMSDLETKDELTRIKLQAGETKARTRRYAFLTKETIDWLKEYRLAADEQARKMGREPSAWVFPGERGGHLGAGAAYYQIKRLFKLAGCKDSEDETYSPHSLRTFADTEMAKAGLDRKYIAAIIGHKSKLASEGHYLDWDEIGTMWKDICEQKLTWLMERIEIITEAKDTKAREALAKLIAAMRKADYSDISEFVPDASRAIEDAERALEDKSG
jgi:integrase